jgi:hypothetical protein
MGPRPIAPTVDAQSFPELAQRPTTSTAVVLDEAPEVPVSKPDGPENLSDSDSDAEDTTEVAPSVASKPGRKEKRKESREFRDQQKQLQKKSRTASSNSFSEETQELMTDVAQSVELGSPTREVQGSIPGGDDSFASISSIDHVTPGGIFPNDPSADQVVIEEDGEMDITQPPSVSNPEEDIPFSSGSIQPGQRPLDSQEASHVSETQESLGIPLGTPADSIKEKALRALKLVNKNPKMGQNPKPRFKH